MMLVALVPALLTWSLGLIMEVSLLLLGLQVILFPALVILISVLFRLPAFYEIKAILANKLTVSNFMKTFNPE